MHNIYIYIYIYIHIYVYIYIHIYIYIYIYILCRFKKHKELLSLTGGVSSISYEIFITCSANILKHTAISEI